MGTAVSIFCFCITPVILVVLLFFARGVSKRLEQLNTSVKRLSDVGLSAAASPLASAQSSPDSPYPEDSSHDDSELVSQVLSQLGYK